MHTVLTNTYFNAIFNCVFSHFQVTIVTDQTSKKQKGISALDEQTQRNLLMSKSPGNPFL